MSFTALHVAAGRGDLEVVDREIDSGVDLNVVGKAGSAMYVAACAGHWPVVLRLLAAGADPNAGRCGKYPLSRAAEAGENEVVEALLDADADVNVVGCHNVAVDDEEGARGYRVDNAEFSPLTIAAWHKHWPVVQTLIAAGADVNDLTFDGSPLIWLTHRSGGADDLRDALIDNPRTELNATFRIKHHDDDPEHQYTLTAFAAETADWPLVLRLAAAGANVDQFDGEDWSVLQRATFHCLHDIVKALLEAGADPNLAAKDGITALHFVRDAAIVRTLVAAGANVDVKDWRGLTPLRTTDEFDSDLEDALLEAGADINAVDNDNVTLLEHAVLSSNISLAQKLLDLGAVFDWTKNDKMSLLLAILTGREDEVDRLVVEGTVRVNKLIEGRRSPLCLAAAAGRAAMVTKLLGLGASIDGVDGRDWTALHWAAHGGCEDVARVLLGSGARLNDDRMRQTALHVAASEGRGDMVRFLIDAGALIDAVDRSGSTPLWLAASKNKWRVVAMLARAQHGLRDCNRALDLAFDGGPSAHGALMALLCAGANLQLALRWALHTASAERVALLLAGGADATNIVSFTHLPLLAATGWQPWRQLTPAELEELHAAIPAAKKQIERAGFAVIRERVLEICVALQAMHLPAPQLIEIVTASCEPFASRLPYHYLWDAVVLIKHFHERSSD